MTLDSVDLFSLVYKMLKNYDFCKLFQSPDCSLFSSPRFPEREKSSSTHSFLFLESGGWRTGHQTAALGT